MSETDDAHREHDAQLSPDAYLTAKRGIRLPCGRCGATALPDGSIRDGLPRGWERFIIRGERRYACPACVNHAGLLAASPW